MSLEYKLEKGKIRNLIKSIAMYKDITLTKMKMLVNEKYNKNDSLENLANKLRKDTIRVEEFIEIMDILGYEIIVKERL